MGEKRQKNQAQLAFPFAGGREASRSETEGNEAPRVRRETENPAGNQRGTEEVCERENRREALPRVRANQGSPGIDGMTVDELPEYLEQPLLSSLVLDELDRELERRGHRFVRNADDSNIYVRSERAGQRVRESVKRFITERLKLKGNESKSAVAKPQARKFLGFSFTSGKELKRQIAPQAIDRFKERVREITREGRGRSMETVMEDLAAYGRG